MLGPPRAFLTENFPDEFIDAAPPSLTDFLGVLFPPPATSRPEFVPLLVGLTLLLELPSSYFFPNLFALKIIYWY